MIFARALGETLQRLLEDDSRVVILGEDIRDPYGGAFKVTRGLSTRFPKRVFTTPVSEAAIVGISAGLALDGFRPITEIMFADFLGLCFDQVINHIAKYQAMYDGKVACPVILRTPSGGGRGYGPTHSQSLEKHFMGIPHLKVVAASLWHDPDVIFRALLGQDAPVLYVEHKLLYPQLLMLPVHGRSGHSLAGIDRGRDGFLPTMTLSPVASQRCSITVVAYGYQALLAERAMQKLAVEEEIFAELLVPAQIAPLDWDPIERSVRRTGRLLTVEEGTGGWSWGSELSAEMNRRLFGRLQRPIRVLASAPSIIPSAAEREKQVLVDGGKIEYALRELAA